MPSTKPLTTTFLATALSVVAVTSPAPTFGEDAADLILQHGVFYPVEAEPVAGSLAIRDGAIVYLGDDAGAAAFSGRGTETIDLAGRAVTPGLIDAHSHLFGLGAALVQVDVVGTASYAEVIERAAAAAAELPAGTWVLGRGWDQNDWPGEKAFPHHRELSAAVPDHPVWLTRIDGHAALVNAAALAALGLDDAVEDPEGGRYLRDAEGRLTGVLIDNAMDAPRGAIPPPSPEEAARRLRLAAEHCLERGLTTVTDMGVSAAMIAAYERLHGAGELPIRAALYLTDDAGLLADWFARGPRIDPAGRLTIRGVKLYADGALGSRGAALIEPYSDDPGNLGLLVSSGDHLAAVASAAVAADFQVAIHAIGDRGNLVALDALDRARSSRAFLDWPRLRIEHAQVMRLQDIVRMAEMGVIASMQPTHATSDMPWAGDRVGDHRLHGAYAWVRVLDAGGKLAFGSDFPVERAAPMLGLHAAVTRQDLEGEPEGGWLPQEKLTRAQALQAFTAGAAEALFLEHLVGSLTVGRRADLVVWERDPMQVPAAEIPSVQADLTLVDGEIVYRREAAR